MTLGAAVRAYLEAIRQRGYAAETLKSRRYDLSTTFRMGGLGPSTPLAEISRRRAEGVLGGLGRFAPQTRFRRAALVLEFARTLRKAGLFLEDPFGGIAPPRKPKMLLGPILSREEMDRLLGAVQPRHWAGTRQRAILELLYSTGLRASECVALEVEDLDLRRGLVRVRAGKGGKDRIIPLGEEAAKALGRYLHEFRSRYAKGDLGALWVGLEGRPVSRHTLLYMIPNLGKKAKIPKPVSPHTIRRTMATHLLSGGASPWIVKEILGHSDARTLGRYVKILPKELKDAHEKCHPRP